MELKTKVKAEEGSQELWITREFDLPLDLLFKAFAEPEIVEQWMGTKVLKLESKKQGSFHFETTGLSGNKINFRGVIHEFMPGQKIIRTFEMEQLAFGVQLEIFTFEELAEGKSKLVKQVIYESNAHRDKNLELPFIQGVNIAHNRLQEVLNKLK